MNRIAVLKVDKKSLEEDLRVAREANAKLEASLREAQEAAKEKEKLAAELKQSNLTIKLLVAEQKADRGRLPELLKAAHSKGSDRIRESIERDLPRLLEEAGFKGERKAIKATHPSSYQQGFLAGLDAAKVTADDGLRGSINVPEAVFPDYIMNLPPTPQVSDDEEDEAEAEEDQAITEDIASLLKPADGGSSVNPPIVQESSEGVPPVETTEGEGGQGQS